jgi:hypothetical protein
MLQLALNATRDDAGLLKKSDDTLVSGYRTSAQCKILQLALKAITGDAATAKTRRQAGATEQPPNA